MDCCCGTWYVGTVEPEEVEALVFLKERTEAK